MRKSPSAKKSSDSTEDTLSHWVKLAFHTMRHEMETSLRKSGMTVTQWRALGALSRKPGTTHSELVKKLEIEASSVTSLVNGMERKGWVTRERSTSDARVKKLFLTPQGSHMIRGAQEETAPIEQRMAATLSERERDALKRLMRTMIEGMRAAP